MGDLEDAFLKRNVPGRYSSWADEDDDERHNNDVDGGGGGGGEDEDEDEDDDDEYYLRDLPPPPHCRASSSSSSTTAGGDPPTSGGTSNTGVKGVLADYRAAAEDERKRAAGAGAEASRALYRATHPATRSGSAAPHGSNRCGIGHRDVGIDDFPSSSEDDDADDRRSGGIRRRRPDQPRGSAARSGRTVGGLGQLTSASPEEYVHLVDEMGDDPRGPFLVVHLSGGGASTRCRMLRSALEGLARSCHHRRAGADGGVGAEFIEVDALEANPNLDTICLPAILVYRRGELVHNLVRFADDLPREFGAGDVRAILEGLGVLGPAISRRDCYGDP